MLNNKDDNPLRIYEARYRTLTPAEITARTNVPFDGQAGAFLLTLLNTPLKAVWPAFSLLDATGCLERAASRLLVLRYLIEGRDLP